MGTCLVGSVRWEPVWLVLLGGNLFGWFCVVGTCLVGSVRWEPVWLVMWGGNLFGFVCCFCEVGICFWSYQMIYYFNYMNMASITLTFEM